MQGTTMTLADKLNEEGRELMRQGHALSGSGQDARSFFSEAEELFREAHALDSANPHYTINVADSLYAQGSNDEGDKFFNQASAELPCDSEHRYGVSRRRNCPPESSGPSDGGNRQMHYGVNLMDGIPPPTLRGFLYGCYELIIDCVVGQWRDVKEIYNDLGGWIDNHFSK
jgi:hypothetical protein